MTHRHSRFNHVDRRWVLKSAAPDSPKATRLVITADGGGSNGSAACAPWKTRITTPRQRTGLSTSSSINLPPGCSKWNKLVPAKAGIEHRLFSFITTNWKARPLISYRVIVDLINATTTKTGLTFLLRTGQQRAIIKGSSCPTRKSPRSTSRRDAFHGQWTATRLAAITQSVIAVYSRMTP